MVFGADQCVGVQWVPQAWLHACRDVENVVRAYLGQAPGSEVDIQVWRPHATYLCCRHVGAAHFWLLNIIAADTACQKLIVEHRDRALPPPSSVWLFIRCEFRHICDSRNLFHLIYDNANSTGGHAGRAAAQVAAEGAATGGLHGGWRSGNVRR